MPKARPEQIAYLAQVLELSEADATKLVEHLESGAKALADMGVNWKEVGADTDTPVTEPVAAAEPPTEPVVSEPPAPEVVTAEPVVTEPVTENEPTEVLLAPETVQVFAQQVLTTVQSTLDAIKTDIQTLTQALAALTQTSTEVALAHKELASTVAELKATDDAKIAAAVKDLPRAVVKSLQAGERPSQRTPDSAAPTKESMLELAKKALYS